LSGNNVTNNGEGVELDSSSGNSIYHNNFINNTLQTLISESYTNAWNESYPSGGNYWSDYNGTDANHDGIGDTPYIIDANNTDHHPLMTPYVIPEFPSFLILPLFFVATLLAVIVHRKKHAKISKSP
jgi:parallel beta-helix repeat protein